MSGRDRSGGGEVSAGRWILHVDMDAFYASVEALDDPSLIGRPVVVGGTGRRGVVASCSYEARAYGVRSAMPSSRARRLCPGAVFVPGRYERYAEVSGAMHAILHQFTPLVEGISLDEAFLDITGSVKLFGPAPTMATAVRHRIGSELGLSCSVGAATVKFLAKLASEAAKPAVSKSGARARSGVFVVPAGGELDFLHPLPIEALWGVGPATARRLRQLGLTSVGDLAAVPPTVLERSLGRAHGHHLAALARGVDDRPVEPDREVKSISHEETFALDQHDPAHLRTEIVRLADAVGTRLRRAGMTGRTVTLKIRYGDFSTITRSVTESTSMHSGPAIASLACALLDQVDVGAGVRLLGVGVSNLRHSQVPGEQLSLMLEASASSVPSGGVRPAATTVAAATDAVEAVRRRFGDQAVGPAVLAGQDGLRVKRRGDTRWGPTEDGALL